MFTTRQQDDWIDLLPLAEFAYNNATHSATSLSPFYATYGYHPSMSFMTPTSSTVPAAEDRVLYLQQIHDELKKLIQIENTIKQKENTIKILNYVHQVFNTGDKVFLRSENIATIVPSRKLAAKFLGPYLITEKISNLLYRLRLPRTLKIHDVFHVSSLEKQRPDTILGRQIKTPPPILTPEGDIEWQVEKVLDSRIFGRWKKLQYLVW